ncbi:MAG: class I SAM-dependent methyltransferase [Anaerolineaceae bacterium]|nr:class I SAM-dependent methyltransferase [Anaerolineaceae bacterium]
MTEIIKEDTYDPAYLEALFAAEQRHFWFLARNRLIANVVRRSLKQQSPGSRILELGCGNGNVLQVLIDAASASRVTGMDLFIDGLRFARRRVECGLVQGDLHQAPFRSCFSLVGMFDVLEHMPDDRLVLNDLRQMLTPDGILVLTVPAYPALWSYFDVAAKHARRYTQESLTAVLQAAGYEVQQVSYFMALSFPLVWLTRRMAKNNPPPGSEELDERVVNELRIIPGLNGLAAAALSLEAIWVGAGRRLPFGTSLVAVARKR